MSLHRYTRVHFLHNRHTGLNSAQILEPSSKESGFGGTYKKGKIHVRTDFYVNVDLILKGVPDYDGGLITTSFCLVVPFKPWSDNEHQRCRIFQKMPFDLYGNLKNKKISTSPHWDVDDSDMIRRHNGEL